MGKKHTEEAVIPILLRKGLVVKEKDYDEHNNEVIVKQIGIPSSVQCGNKILGKLDFMRKMGWTVMKSDDMTVIKRPQKKKFFKSKRNNDPMKDSFKRKKNVVNLKNKNQGHGNFKK